MHGVRCLRSSLRTRRTTTRGSRLQTCLIPSVSTYIVRRSVMEEGTRPEYTIPISSSNYVWGMVKRVGMFNAEGWLALFKGESSMRLSVTSSGHDIVSAIVGLLTSCVNDVLSSTLQPTVQIILQSIFTPSPSKSPSIFLPVPSHLPTGPILSPLDLVRTRLIVQSFLPKYRSCAGPLDALSKTLRDEGVLKGVYLHSCLVIPAILDTSLDHSNLRQSPTIHRH